MKNIKICVSSDKSNKVGFEIDHIETTYKDGLQPNDNQHQPTYFISGTIIDKDFPSNMGFINRNNLFSRDASTILIEAWTSIPASLTLS